MDFRAPSRLWTTRLPSAQCWRIVASYASPFANQNRSGDCSASTCARSSAAANASLPLQTSSCPLRIPQKAIRLSANSRP
eukprot:2566869-Prymnesium_polylepis.3